MSDNTDKKQENQKTVVAFIAGLLIGGLLVWVFSAAPNNEGTDADMADDDTELSDSSSDAMDDMDTNASDSEDSRDTSSDVVATQQPSTSGSVSVADQAAGSEVDISDIEFPTDGGWVVVRDYVDGQAGGILGAARYELSVGLVPERVTLLRATEAGSTYQVVFYSEDGDREFDTDVDAQIDGAPMATFDAE